MPGTSFAVGDELGFIALVSANTGAVESVRDGRLSMSLRELSDVNFSTASEPAVTLRYLASDLPDEADLSGRRDVLELLATNASKTIEVAQGPPGSPLHYFIDIGLYPVILPYPIGTQHKIPSHLWAATAIRSLPSTYQSRQTVLLS